MITFSFALSWFISLLFFRPRWWNEPGEEARNRTGRLPTCQRGPCTPCPLFKVQVLGNGRERRTLFFFFGRASLVRSGQVRIHSYALAISVALTTKDPLVHTYSHATRKETSRKYSRQQSFLRSLSIGGCLLFLVIWKHFQRDELALSSRLRATEEPLRSLLVYSLPHTPNHARTHEFERITLFSPPFFLYFFLIPSFSR